MTRHIALIGLCASLFCGGLESRAFAEPQWDSSLRAGVAGGGTRSSPWQTTYFYGALNGDVLFGRSSSSDLGLGPFVDISTVGFSDLRLSAGPTLLVPLSSLVTQVSIGGYVIPTSPSAAGLHTQLFVGGRSYNYHANYSPSLGLVLGLDYGLSNNQIAMTGAVSIDLEYVAIPFLILYGTFRRGD
ncbi:MAG TPA: hypothetical protein VL137_07475 [Polyangiaceae bacterium]|jgi:hypothetical protein|nr:hypothetical protein [Polyangiaceae bacterium]